MLRLRLERFEYYGAEQAHRLDEVNKQELLAMQIEDTPEQRARLLETLRLALGIDSK